MTTISETSTLATAGGDVIYWPLSQAADQARLAQLPFTIRVFLENALRSQAKGAGPEHVEALTRWPSGSPIEVPFYPARVVLQDLTGVPVVADLAALRNAVERLGGDPTRVNPTIAGDLVIDHSVMVDVFGVPEAFQRNVAREFERNRERYSFLRWAQSAFDGFRVVPPGAGIVHQVNLEFFATSVITKADGDRTLAYPDTLLGADSHTTMIGGLGVLGWGVGGIEAEAAMLGEPVALLTPEVVGVRLTGRLREGATATDLVLAITEVLRQHGVVGKFVEFFGRGLDSLTVPDRATISNMSPEYGATEGLFPVDAQTIAYLRGTGRSDDLCDLVERYFRAQTMFRDHDSPDPVFEEQIDFDLGSVEPSLAGPSRPQDRVALAGVKPAFRTALGKLRGDDEIRLASTPTGEVRDGSVVIAAITSCTNTSNPSVMVASGLLARNAVARGLSVKTTVKTSLAPGSPVVMDYLERADLIAPLEQLGFYLVGFGCTTCIGNSGDELAAEVGAAVRDGDLACASVLSGNRNFEGRIHPQVRFSFLASPPLVVAYALAGTVDIDLDAEPLGTGSDGTPVYLRDIWPSSDEVASTVAASMSADAYTRRYGAIFDGTDNWRSLDVKQGVLYDWDQTSTYIVEPPFVADMPRTAPAPADVRGARVLALVGDSVTTDHISPASAIPAASPSGEWLIDHGVQPREFNSYGARRGNHHVMLRGTFGNIRLRNALAAPKEGGYTRHFPSGEEMTIFAAAQRYRSEDVPLIVLAGKEYGTGSSRDWAAKGTRLLGVRAVIAQSYERIHRSNLIQMGVLPLQFAEGESAQTLGLDGTETYDLTGLAGAAPGVRIGVVARRNDGTVVEFETESRLDTPTEVRHFREGGILPAVVRDILRG